MKKSISGFSVSELIVVCIIMIILATISFISYVNYLEGVRDTSRVTQLSQFSKSLEIYSSEHLLPLPEDSIEIQANGEVIGWQGYLGADALRIMNYTGDGIDPSDKGYFSYYVTKDQKYFQVMGFLEHDQNLPGFGIQEIDAVDYTLRYPTIFGDKLGILTDEFNTPVHQLDAYSGGFLDLTTQDSDIVFISHIENLKSYKFTGEVLANKLYTLSKPGKYGPTKSCPSGFIGVRGDVTFDQEGFCVAQYEMTYSQSDSPGTPDFSYYPQPVTADSDPWATYDYDDSKKIMSRSDYPIAMITQTGATQACESMGRGYHLITNNEWMTIARNIEFEAENWSNKTSGNYNLSEESVDSGYIYNGNSGEASGYGTYGCTGTGYYDGVHNRAGNASGPTSQEEGCNQKRSLSLFGGNIIRDFAGNVWEHVNKGNTVSGSGYNIGHTSIGTSTSEAGWDTGSITITQKENYGPLLAEDTENGIGVIYYGAGFAGNSIYRGGSAWDIENTGIYSIGLDIDDSNSYANLGFRCAK